MSGPLLVLAGFVCLLSGLLLGYRSLPRPGVGPASAPRRRAQGYSAAFLITVPWLAMFTWLSVTVAGWPQAYGSTCSGRRCFVEDLLVSPGLLEGGWREVALFATLWFWPVFILLFLGWAAAAGVGIFARREAK